MPLYSYECPRGHKFEKIVPIAKMDDYQECPGKLVNAGKMTKPKVVSKSPKTLVAAAIFEIVPCRTPAKRIPVPSRPAYVIIH